MQLMLGITCIIISIIWKEIEIRQNTKDVTKYISELREAREEYKKFKDEYYLKTGCMYIPPSRFKNSNR